MKNIFMKWICDVRKENSLPKTKEIPMPKVKPPRNEIIERLQQDNAFLKEVITVVNHHLLIATNGKGVNFEDHRIQTAVSNAYFFCNEQKRKRIESIRGKLTREELDLIDYKGIINRELYDEMDKADKGCDPITGLK